MSPTGGIEIGALLWKVTSGGFAVLSALLIYFIKKRDQKIDENTRHVESIKEKVIVLETKFDMYSSEQMEMKENIKGLIDCVQDIRVTVSGYHFYNNEGVYPNGREHIDT